MSLISQHEYHRRRAQRVMDLLRELWGEELPAGSEPELTVLIDAVAGDDHLGSQDGYVVQSDRLTYEALALLLRRCSTPDIAARAMPRELLSRIFAASSSFTPTHLDLAERELSSAHLTDLNAQELNTKKVNTKKVNTKKVNTKKVNTQAPDKHDDCDVRGFADPLHAVGTWHLDGEQQLLSWDETCAELLERQEAPRYINIMEELEVWTHPADRAALAEGWQRCIQTAAPHQARFRAMHPRGGYIPCFAGGRRIIDAAGKVHIVGFLQHDQPLLPS